VQGPLENKFRLLQQQEDINNSRNVSNSKNAQNSRNASNIIGSIYSSGALNNRAYAVSVDQQQQRRQQQQQGSIRLCNCMDSCISREACNRKKPCNSKETSKTCIPMTMTERKFLTMSAIQSILRKRPFSF